MSELLDDDRLLHEVVWAAEALIQSMTNDKRTLIAPGTAAQFVNLEGWCDRVRQEWESRSTEPELPEKNIGTSNG